ncbi:hypothetical protein ACR6C2_37555 [Streptomyces sp. INA 01156]
MSLSQHDIDGLGDDLDEAFEDDFDGPDASDGHRDRGTRQNQQNTAHDDAEAGTDWRNR